MKTKVNANNSAKSNTAAKDAEKAKIKIVVPADVKAGLQACFKADGIHSAAVKGQEQAWVSLGGLLAKKYPADSAKEAEEARNVLKQAFSDAGKDPKEITVAGYVSKILALGFPAKPEAFQQAKADGLKTNALLAVARGTLVKKGKEWVKKAKKGDGRGGSNKNTPAETFEKRLLLAFTDATTAKLKIEAVARVVVASLADTIYDLDDFASEIESAVAKAKAD